MDASRSSPLSGNYIQVGIKRSASQGMGTLNDDNTSDGIDICRNKRSSSCERTDSPSPEAPPGSPAGTDPRFDAVYIDDPSQFDALIERYHQTHSKHQLRMIKTPQDIDTQDLVKKIVIRRGADNQMIEEELPGLLFNDEPAVIFIDAAHMSAGQLAGLNELMEPRPKYQTHYLSNTCRVVVLLSAKMHRIPRSQNTGKPGMDFVRRVGRYTNSWSIVPSSSRSSSNRLDMESVPVDCSPADTSCKVLDFQYREWKDVLYGVYDLDANNNPTFKHSVLHELAQQSGQNPVAVFRGAPWHDPAFRLAVAELKAKGCYQVNGEIVSTESVNFAKQDVEPEALKNRLRGVFNPQVTGVDYFCLNQSNLEDILSDTAIKDGKVVADNVLSSILEKYPCLRITSRLTEEQWLKLLLKLESCNLSQPVPLVIDNPMAQPMEFQLTDPCQNPAAIAHPNIMVLQDDEAYLVQQVSANAAQKWGGKQQNFYSLSLTPDLEASDITSCLKVRSFARREFGVASTSLIEALEKGVPVVLRNLHKNHAIQQNLESLLSDPPFLLINGERKEFPAARLIVLQPENGTFTSPVWKGLESENRPLTEDTKSQYFQKYFKLSSEEYTNLQKLLAVMETIPASSNRLWPHPAQGMTFDVVSKLVTLAQQACEQQTSSKNAQRCTEHWRKALSVGLFEEYRCAPEVYSYLMLACDKLFPAETPQDESTDVAAIERFLDEHGPVNEALAKKHIWSLSRLIPSCRHSFFKLTDKYDEPPEVTVQAVRRILVRTIYNRERQSRVNPSVVCSRKEVEQQLSDALLASRWTIQAENSMDTDGLGRLSLTEDQLVQMAGSVCSCLADASMSADNRRTNLEKILEGFPNASRLAESLLSGNTDWEICQNSRYQQLAQLLTDQRIVSLKGEAGAGKTHTARQVARALNPHQLPITVSVSPQDTQASLLRQQVTVPIPVTLSVNSLFQGGLSQDDIVALAAVADSASTDAHPMLTLTLTKAVKTTLRTTMSENGYEVAATRFSDIGTEEMEGPLLRWAKTESENGHPVILIIDEGNLASPALWDMLQGMQGKPPFICSGGERICLTKNHRIIFTGNPESAPGRHISLSLRNQMATLYYPALPDEFLKSAIAGKRLLEAETLNTEQQTVCLDHIMGFWAMFRKILPEHEFTPRDLNEICDRLLRYISMETTDSLQDTLLIQLAWLAVSETLGGECHPGTTHLETLKLNFQTQHPEVDLSGWSAVEKSFETFFLNLGKQTTEQFTVNTSSVRSLARTLWSALQGQKQEKEKNKIALGKHASLIEGPPGRGKDVLLDLVLHTERPEACVSHLNAGVSDWEEVKSAIQTAAKAGEVIAISELNLLPSEFLEGELNDLLTGDASPGFHLIATVNSPEFSGRMPFSPALQSRFVQHKIADYGDEELHSIALNNLRDQQHKAALLTGWHCDLRRITQGMGIGLQPCTSDLSLLLTYVGRYPGISQQQLEELFYQQHRILFESARITQNQVFAPDQAVPTNKEHDDHAAPIEDMDTQQAKDADKPIDQGLASPFLSMRMDKNIFVKTLSKCFPGETVPAVSQGSSNHYDPVSGTVTLKAQAFDYWALLETTHQIMEYKWRSSVVPDVYPLHSDTLGRALLVNWKRAYASSVMPEPNHPAAQALLAQRFAYANDESFTLELPENAPYIDAINRLLTEKGPAPECETFQEFLEILRTPLAHLEQALLSDADSADESMNAVEKSISLPAPVIIPLSRYDSGMRKRIDIWRVFPRQGYSSVRESLMTPTTDRNGDLALVVNCLGQSGFSLLTCINFETEHGMHDTQFQSRQTLKADGQWQVLSAHKEASQAYPKAIGATPSMAVEIIKDRASGLFLARIRNEDNKIAGNVTIDIVFENAEASSDNSSVFCGGYSPCFLSSEAALAVSVVQKHTGEDITELRGRLGTCASLQQKRAMIRAFCESGQSLKPFTITQGAYEQWQALLDTLPVTPENRCLVFWALANYCNIPCRIGRGQGNGNVWVETLLPGSVQWEVHNLGGVIENPDLVMDLPTRFPEIKTSMFLTSDMISRTHAPNRSKRYSAEEVKTLLNEIKPTTSDYDTLCIVYPVLIADNISRSGPVTVGLTKAWLETYMKEERNDRNEQDQVKKRLSLLLEKLNVRTKDEDTQKADEVRRIYHELVQFIISKDWLSSGFLVNEIHSLLDQSVKTRMSLAAKHSLYREQLTRELKLGKDIRRARPGDKLAKDDLDSGVLEAVSQVLIGHTAPELIKQLHAEVPGIEYTMTPPGRVCADRMLRRLPSFQRSATVSVIRPALVVTPLLRYCGVFAKHVQTCIAKTDVPVDGIFQKKRSDLFADYIVSYIRFAFLKYLYESSGGTSGRMKSFCIHESIHGYTAPLDAPYKPETSGVFTPEGVDEFYEIASASTYNNVEVDASLLNHAWIQEGFNESSLCLLSDENVEECVKSFLDGADWKRLLEIVEPLCHWREYVKFKCKTKETELNHMISFAREKIENCRSNGENPDESDIEFVQLQGWLVDDIDR